MVHLPESCSNIACVVGIDPGSETLGFATIEFNLDTLEITRTQAFTLKASKLLSHDDIEASVMGERYSRIQVLRKVVLNELIKVRPMKIAVESPFYSQKRPSAFGVLIEVLEALRQAVRDYDVWKNLLVVDPPTVKKAVGGSGNAKKDEMHRKVLAMTELKYEGNTFIENLDDHSIDAIAVAYWCFKNLIKL